MQKHYYWPLHQCNRAWFAYDREKITMVTNLYLLWWSIIKVRIFVCSLII